MGVENVPTFHWADYLVLGVFLGFATLLGLVIGFRDRRNATAKNFLMGGGDMHYIPVALSMQASFLSAIFILSTPTEIYNFGTMYSYLAVSYVIGIPIAAYMYLPTFHRLHLTSAYEYLERRFNRSVRLAGALTFAVMVILYMAVVLYSPAIALAQVTGLTVELSISVCGVVCVFYTVIGGMKATIWNDFIQMVVIIIGLVILIILGSIKVVGNFWNIANDGGRIEFDNFDPDPTVRTTFWTQTVGGTFLNLTLYASSQTIIQKFLSIKKLKNAQKSMWVATLASIVFLVLVVLTGLVMYAFYSTCDPLLAKRITKADQMVPLFIMEILGDLPGLPGLLIAATFSAALSSISGSLNALSAVFLIDFIRPAVLNVTKKPMSERASNITSRCLALGFGLFTILMGFLAQFFGDLILQMALSIFGFVGGPLSALLSLGLFLPFVNSWGAMAGLLCSLGFTCWVAIGALVAKVPTPKLAFNISGCPDDFDSTTTSSMDYTSAIWMTAAPSDDSSSILWVYKLSHMYYSLIALMVAVVVGVLVSLITGRAKNTDPKLTFQWGSKCCCYCPRSIRDCLGAADSDSSDDEDQQEDRDNDADNSGTRQDSDTAKDSSNVSSSDDVPVSFSVASDTKTIPTDANIFVQEEDEHIKKTEQQTDEGTTSPTPSTDNSTGAAMVTEANEPYSIYPAPDYDTAI